MKRIRVKVPGSCGELIQGFYGESEALISYAIDCYSTVTIEPSDHYTLKIDHQNEKAMIALRKACDYFGVELDQLNIRINSDIPVGKGMASSTADIVGVLAAVSAYTGKIPESSWLGKMAASIEPTDNTMFKEWVLFDHLNGEVIEQFDHFENVNVIVLEMDETIDTKKLRESGAFSKSTKPNPSRALDVFREAMDTKDLKRLGDAMVLSAQENQSILFKPYLNELTDLAKNYGMIGINTAHSGTVLGVVFSSGVDPEAFLLKADELGYLEPYSKRYIHKIILGGPVIEME